MPEGPEVRKYADALAGVLVCEPITAFSARTRKARQWLQEHPDVLIGRHVAQVRSRGKNLIGGIEGGFYFYTHLLMWGSWKVITDSMPIETDRRERARITVPNAAAILLSAPIFEVGEGDPWRAIPTLSTLGPDILPYPDEGSFDAAAFLARLLSTAHKGRAIGAALLDQTIIAGIGNYLRAEVMFECRINPWRPASELTPEDLDCLCRTIPTLAARAHRTGAVVSEDLRARMREDASLVYRPGSDWGTRHAVFRRTNLPCLVCGTTIRQRRQFTHVDEEGERTRITYFCPKCQNVAP